MEIKLILTLPRGGCTSKKNVLFMYQLPIFPKCVSSQLNNNNNKIKMYQSIQPKCFVDNNVIIIELRTKHDRVLSLCTIEYQMIKLLVQQILSTMMNL